MPSKIIEKDFTEIQINNVKCYYSEVLHLRALPDPRDGLKPVQRYIDYSMYKDGFTSDKPYKKSARIVGNVIGEFSPHGDASTYDTLVKMYAPWKNFIPLVEKHGNFSSQYAEGSQAKMRYTESRSSKKAELLLLEDLKYNSVDHQRNYDNSENEPKVLPSKIPLLLINGSFGIAAGYMSSIPSSNPIEMGNNLIHYIKTGEYITTLPDSPAGGILLNSDKVKNCLEGGEYTALRLRARIIKDYENNKLTITEIPYNKYLNTIIKSIKNVIMDRKEKGKLIPKKIDGIKKLKNDSEKGSIEVNLYVKKGYDLDTIENLLYKNTDCEVSIPIIPACSYDRKLKVYKSQKEIMDVWLDFRRSTLIRIKNDLIKGYKYREYTLNAVITVLNDKENYLNILKKAKDKSELIEIILNKYNLRIKQATYIAEMPTYRLTSMEISNLQKDLEKLEEKINQEIKYLKDKKLLDTLIIDDIKQMMKLTNEHKKRKMSLENIDPVNIIDTIAEKDFIFLITNNGYIKKFSSEDQKVQKRGGTGNNIGKIKDDDSVKFNFIANDKNTLFFFTDKGNLYTRNSYEIPETKKNKIGFKINQFISLKDDEKIVSVIDISKDDLDNKNMGLLFVTENNKIKITSLSEYKRTNGVIGCGIIKDDNLLSVNKIDLNNKEISVYCGMNNGIGMNIEISTIPVIGKNAYGSFIFDNQFFKSNEENKITSVSIINKNISHICILTEKGLIKKVKILEFPKQKRGGKGRITCKLKENDKMIKVLSLSENDKNIQIISNLMTINIPSDDISESLRPSYGSKCKKMKEDEFIIDFLSF